MSTRFNSREGLIVVRAQVIGPVRQIMLRLAVDTGATSTLLGAATLVAVGYDPIASPDRVEIVTGSAIEFASVVRVGTLRALGKTKRNFLVVAHTLPPEADIDGLIGLDFLRGTRLTIDFVSGTLSLGSRK